MPSFSWPKHSGSRTELRSPGKLPDVYESEIIAHDGDLKFVLEKGGNDAFASYQESSGAPVEQHSPLGYGIQWYSAVFLNVGGMIGTGVFSTPASIFKGVGSVGLSMIFWTLGFFISAASLALYLELASFFPSRSGSVVVYLEQAYPRPKYFFPTVFAVMTVALSFSSSNAIVLAQYLFRLADHKPTDWQLKGVAVVSYTVALMFVIASTRLSLLASNVIGVIKILTLTFISITGFVVLGGHTSVKNPTANFHNAFEGTSSNGNGLATALVKITFAYSGYQNAFSVINEVKNPIPTLKKSASLSLLVVATLYVCCNIAYFAALTKAELRGGTQIVASLFFRKVFGSAKASRSLNFLIMISSFGNLVSVLIGHARMIRECGRQGVLPYPKFWASTKPFGTPLGPYILKWGMTILMIIAPPAGDAFNFIVDLGSYPETFFAVAMTAGIYLIRSRRKRLEIPRSEFRAWDVAIIFSLLVNVFLLVMPWYPPTGGKYGGDVSFWYASYCVVGIGILLVCALYYCVWIYILPRLGKYQMRQELILLPEGATTHALIKVPNDEVELWDSTHDATGKLRPEFDPPKYN